MTSPLILEIRLINCSRANARRGERKDVDGNKSGQLAIVPESYEFRTPCPWGKTAPDSGCMHCVHHQQIPLAHREMTEDEADILTDQSPESWVATR